MRSWGCVVTSKSELNRAGVPDYVILQGFDFNFPNKYERWRIRKLPVRIPKSHFPQLNLICAGITFDGTAGLVKVGWIFGVVVWRSVADMKTSDGASEMVLLMCVVNFFCWCRHSPLSSWFTLVSFILSKTYENDKKSASDIKMYLIRAVVPTCSGMLE